jgi:hypothetical protein
VAVSAVAGYSLGDAVYAVPAVAGYTRGVAAVSVLAGLGDRTVAAAVGSEAANTTDDDSVSFHLRSRRVVDPIAASSTFQRRSAA